MTRWKLRIPDNRVKIEDLDDMVEFEIDDRVEIDFLMTRFNVEFLMIGLNVGFLITRLKLEIPDDKVKFFRVFIFTGLTPILSNGRVGLH